MQSTFKILAIIVTYNGSKWIEKCLSCIYNSTLEIIPIIVDNNSTDNTISLIKKTYPQTLIISNKYNTGFGEANNIGVKYVMNLNPDFVLLVNQDAYIQPNTVEKLLKFNDNNTILSPMHLNGVGSKIDRNFKKNSILNIQNEDFLDKVIIENNKSYKFDVEFINAAFWLIPKSVILKIGGFNPLFFHYGEDVNYLNRVKYHGVQACVVSNTYIMHDRELFGNPQSFYDNYYKREILLINTNINNSLLDLIKKNFIFIVRILYSISKLKFRIACYQLIGLISIISKIKRIVRSRKKEKTIGLNWL